MQLDENGRHINKKRHGKYYYPIELGKEEKWYFVTKIVLNYCEKKIVLLIEKNILRSLYRTINSNSERSEQFLVTEYFFNLFLEVSQKLLGFRNMQEKLEKGL